MDYYLIPNLLSENECDKLLDKYSPMIEEEIDFIDYQNNRYDFRDASLSKVILEKLVEISKTRNLELPSYSEINHKWYAITYLPNSGFISEHQDGHVYYDGLASNYTLIIYLNDDFEEGQTVICGEPEIIIKPKKGSCLLLKQDILHYAKKPQKNSKVILRSDLMFSQNSSPLLPS